MGVGERQWEEKEEEKESKGGGRDGREDGGWRMGILGEFEREPTVNTLI